MAVFIFRLFPTDDPGKRGFVRRRERKDISSDLDKVWGNQTNSAAWNISIAWYNEVSSYTVRSFYMYDHWEVCATRIIHSLPRWTFLSSFNFASVYSYMMTFGKFVQWDSSLSRWTFLNINCSTYIRVLLFYKFALCIHPRCLGWKYRAVRCKKSAVFYDEARNERDDS